jgi:hypothetical protein
MCFTAVLCVCAGYPQAEALEWGAPGYEEVVRSLASRKPELLLAGDTAEQLQCLLKQRHNAKLCFCLLA